MKEEQRKRMKQKFADAGERSALNKHTVSWRSKQLVCPNCGSFAIETTHNHQHDCFDCGESWWTN